MKRTITIGTQEGRRVRSKTPSSSRLPEAEWSNNRRLISTAKYYRNLGSVRKRQIFHNAGLGVRISSDIDGREWI